MNLTGEALKALLRNGVDEKRRIIGKDAPRPVLFNVPMELIERFRKQLTLIDLQFEGNQDAIRQGVWSCYQENPVEFMGYSLFDCGAYPEPPLSGKLSWCVFQPWAEPEDQKEQETLEKARVLMERLKARTGRN